VASRRLGTPERQEPDGGGTWRDRWPARRAACVLLILLPCLLFPGRLLAWSLADARAGYGQFGLGLIGGLAMHEFGHFVVASAKGYRVRFDGPSLVYPDLESTGAERLQVASAGFQAQWLLTELSFVGMEGDGPWSDNFGAGTICAHLGISLAYLTFLKDHHQGDVVGMAEAVGMSHDQVALAVAVPAALDAWRLFGTQPPAWLPRLSMFAKGIGVGWVWTY